MDVYLACPFTGPSLVDGIFVALLMYSYCIFCFKLTGECTPVSLKLVRMMEEQGKEWQSAARLRDLAAVSELRRDIVKVMERFAP